MEILLTMEVYTETVYWSVLIKHFGTNHEAKMKLKSI